MLTSLLLAATALAAPVCESPESRALAERASPTSLPPFRYIHPKNAPTKCITGVQGIKGYEGTVLTM